MVLSLLILLCPFASVLSTKVVPFGETASAETLFPLPTHPADTFVSNVHSKRLINDVSLDGFSLWGRQAPVTADENDEEDAIRWVNERRADDSDSDSDGHSNETSDDDDDDDQPEFSGDDSDQPDFSGDDSDQPGTSGDDSDDPDWEPPDTPKPGKFNSDTNDDVPDGPMRGTMQLDCLETPEGCQNACYYQNCVMGAKGDYRKVTYQRSRPYMGNYNRAQSGVKVSGGGTPCNTGPFAQKFWDTYPFNLKSGSRDSEHVLEADEWPMASMYSPDFDTGKENARSLRCSTKRGNGIGGDEAQSFYDGRSEYARGGKWAQHRTGSGPLIPGDKFNVNFNFDSFDPTNPTHEKTRKYITYCEGPWTDFDAKCKNDGRQFHLSALRLTDPPKDDPQGKGKSGRIGAKYDTTYHNAYRLYDEKEDLNQYHIHLELTGKDTDEDFEVAAKVFRFKATKGEIGQGKLEQVGQTKNAGVVKDGETFTVDGVLPRPLKIEKSGSGCGTYTFTYGGKDDGNRAFRFKSDDKSVLKDGKFVFTEAEPSPRQGQYCVPRPMEEIVQTVSSTEKGKGKGKVKETRVRIGTRLECSFPGW